MGKNILKPNLQNLQITPLQDKHGRTINYLRLSVTDRCNMKCLYCSPSITHSRLPKTDTMSINEINRIVNIFASLGVSKIRLTGGEPLLRKDLPDIVKELKLIPGISEVTLTTNGFFLSDQALALKNSGLERLNVSLDSLDPNKFKKITGGANINSVLEGIEAALRAGFKPVKINSVLIESMDDNDIINLASLSFFEDIHIRFIEQMPFSRHCVKKQNKILSPHVVSVIEKRFGPLIPVRDNNNNPGPARRFHIGIARGELGFISMESSCFCKTCNRIRITSNGLLRPCLLNDSHFDIKTMIRAGFSDQEIEIVIRQAVLQKAPEYLKNIVKTKMVQIGG